MKRKRRLILFLSCICIFFQSTSQTDKVYVCPVENDIISKLVQYRYQLLCNHTSTDCQLSRDFRTDPYSLFVILLHNRNWTIIRKVTALLSNCNTKYVLIDVISPKADQMSMCSTDQITLVFSLTNDVYSTQVDFSNEDCIAKTLTRNDSLEQYMLASTCRNTIWVSGNEVCQNFICYGEKIFAVDNSKNTIRDKTLGKMYLRGKHLRLGMAEDKPYFFEISPGVYSGVLHNLVEKMASNNQFSYTIFFPEDTEYGSRNEDGTWTGMIGELLNNKTDMIVSDLTVTYLRSQYIDFTLPYYFESIGILIRQPELDNKLWKMFSLFPSIVWLSLLATAVTASLFVYSLHRFSAVPIQSPMNKIGECVWCTVCCFSNQGIEYDPERMSLQIFIAIFLLCVFAVLTIYSGGLIATLTTSHLVLPFKNLEELSVAIKNGNFNVCVATGTAFYSTLMGGFGVYGPIKEFLDKNPTYQTSDGRTCVELLQHFTDVAYLEDVTILESIQTDNCHNFNLILLNDKFFPGYFSIALPKNSPLNAIFSQEITNAVDGGLIVGWKKNFTQFSTCEILQPDDTVTTSSSELSLSEFTGPFILLAIGIVVSLLCFFFEVQRFFHPKHKMTTKVVFINVKMTPNKFRCLET